VITLEPRLSRRCPILLIFEKLTNETAAKI
jgi:hypothetical protein